MSAAPKAHYKLFSPLGLGQDLVLKNRVVMSPMTRSRADPETHVPSPLATKYYEQRAGAGLVVTEATAVSAQGFGWYGSPGMYTDGQERAWTEIADRVHAKDGLIFMQLWHMGRRAHSSYNGGLQVVAPSASEKVDGNLKNAVGDEVSFEAARALEIHEIEAIIDDHRSAAERAKRAGFDGIEVHGANGYLVDQFLQSSTNQRTDQYGGSIKNRSLFLVQLVEALTTVFPPSRIGVRFSPNGAFGGMGSNDNYGQFLHAMRELSKRGVGYVTMMGDGFGVHDKGKHISFHEAKQAFQGVVVATIGFSRDSAEGAIGTGAIDAVAFGRPFLANPDLADRFLNDLPLHENAPLDVWYDNSKREVGYTTYEKYPGAE